MRMWGVSIVPAHKITSLRALTRRIVWFHDNSTPVAWSPLNNTWTDKLDGRVKESELLEANVEVLVEFLINCCRISLINHVSLITHYPRHLVHESLGGHVKVVSAHGRVEETVDDPVPPSPRCGTLEQADTCPMEMGIISYDEFY